MCELRAKRLLFLIDLVQTGTSEKIALSMQYLSAFVAGFVLAYIRNWRLALALTSILPCVILTGSLMNHFIAKYMQCVPNPHPFTDKNGIHLTGTCTIDSPSSKSRTVAAWLKKSFRPYALHRRLAPRVRSQVYTMRMSRMPGYSTQKPLSGMAVAWLCFISSFILLMPWLFRLVPLLSMKVMVSFARPDLFLFPPASLYVSTASAGAVVNVVLAILIGSLSLGLLAPEMQGQPSPRFVYVNPH